MQNVGTLPKSKPFTIKEIHITMKRVNFAFMVDLLYPWLNSKKTNILKQPSYYTYPYSHGKGVKAQQRIAHKKRAVKRARRLGHAN